MLINMFLVNVKNNNKKEKTIIIGTDCKETSMYCVTEISAEVEIGLDCIHV